MKFYSTGHNTNLVSFAEAIMSGRAADGGLYMPQLTRLPGAFFNNLPDMTLQDIAYVIMQMLVKDDMTSEAIKNMVDDALDFEIPLVYVENNIYSLEMFHGPTLAFKDVGARFLSRLLTHFCHADEKNPISVLVATTGDAGSAIAGIFYNIPGINVFIVYPHGRVSREQEAQFATLRGNIYPIEVDGSFDDCQTMVNGVFSNRDFCRQMRLTSANTINPARLLPQVIPFIWGVSQLRRQSMRRCDNIYVSVPSGNLGNLCAALIAKRIGLPVNKFIAANNLNGVFTDFLNSGQYIERNACPTLATAMDVGKPSNISRIIELYRDNYGRIDMDKLRKEVIAVSVSDDKIIDSIKYNFEHNNYLLEPHGAVAEVALKEKMPNDAIGFFMATAHPAKFGSSVRQAINRELPSKYDVLKPAISHKFTYRIPPTVSALHHKLSVISNR